LSDISDYQKRQDDKTVSLKEAVRISERDKEKAEQLARINERLARFELEKVESVDEAPELISELDPFLEEAASITADLLMVSRLAKK
jgi:carboxyl-terminal processing protease